MINKLLGICILLVAFNCKSTQNQSKMAKEDIVLIGKGNLYGSGAEGIEKENLIISNQDEWEELLQKVNASNDVSKSFSETKIDFTKYTVIAVFDAVKTSGGHSLELEVKDLSDKTEVFVIQKSPDGMAASVMTQPYYIVKIPKTNLPIIFK